MHGKQRAVFFSPFCLQNVARPNHIVFAPGSVLVFGGREACLGAVWGNSFPGCVAVRPCACCVCVWGGGVGGAGGHSEVLLEALYLTIHSRHRRGGGGGSPSQGRSGRTVEMQSTNPCEVPHCLEWDPGNPSLMDCKRPQLNGPKR